MLEVNVIVPVVTGFITNAEVEFEYPIDAIEALLVAYPMELGEVDVRFTNATFLFATNVIGDVTANADGVIIGYM
jgi:hypothetical protein